MSQLENIEAIERRLWKSADTLRSNSELASNEYFLPVMGLIFLRHAYSRFLAVQDDIVASLPSRGGKTRKITKQDFSGKSAIYLKEEAQFDHLIALTDSDDRSEAIIQAMESIESEYENLKGQLPKQEYRNIPNDVLKILLNTLNPEELQKASGDIFGRIYEYFLTQFADQGAHDGGEFFTPVSLVQLIVNVLEPDHGKIFDPACGSGGMFVQSAHFMEQHKHNPTELTFYGHEKNRVTTRLAKMNLAVHGLEGNVEGGDSAITYYKDPHSGLFGTVDYVMANPPFNVDEVDATKVKNDPRLPFGLPGENKNKKVPNANYLWVQYFYSYLNNTGKAGFVMSSQASSAGRDEAKVREALVKTGHVDAMVDIRGNFFYTRSVPCQLWFLNKAKPEAHKDKVLMIDARNVYRKVTRKIFDFSPEQQQNLTAIVWLYRGERRRFIELVIHYLNETLVRLTDALLPSQHQRALLWCGVKTRRQLRGLQQAVDTLQSPPELELETLGKALDQLFTDVAGLKQQASLCRPDASDTPLAEVHQREQAYLPFADTCRHLIKDVDHLVKLASGMTAQAITCLREELLLNDAEDNELSAAKKASEKGKSSQPLTASDEQRLKTLKATIDRMSSLRSSLQRNNKVVEQWRKQAVEQLKQVRYFHQQAHWLLSRFPEAELRDVEGLVKLVTQEEIEKADWSLTPGRYVGVAPEAVDEDFDFEAALKDIHIELEGLNEEAVVLAGRIARNFEGLGV
ncbi:N-6 DNA methylase [Endozoicomonas gorgoniicola]|uniref:site-specific DNA-methyltransferase (adenine-specific) n=1 Tax=Endozoicomonas gorgoniicola TaxID=1234144 RepID=A0ABT3N259_9GAMM|nr:N-6 DNA methylase [Endozoicomonas gorgoniicola]MCW7555696.1 N-6 DNA methylase [Endozoicomonas gorgoniicola]